ncbi:MAG: DUF115 domain-containing protein [Thermoplasmata archaeon]|nr:DUF115 domain-containing protein [Thermoplasmata archaeon]
MDYAAWAPYYERIRLELGFDLARERSSADRLLELLPADAPLDPLGHLQGLVRGRDAIVVGLAPRWGAPPIWVLPAGRTHPVVLAADGAASRCLDAGIVPEIVVTDLDGPVPAEVLANSKGAAVVLHAHGDNLEALDRWAPEFHRNVVGSWAGKPEPRLLDVGGFTDGDRAAFLASALGARRVLLWGFEFANVDEEPPGQRLRKLAKLRWAREVLGVLSRSGAAPLLWWRRDGAIVPYEVGISGASTQ